MKKDKPKRGCFICKSELTIVEHTHDTGEDIRKIITDRYTVACTNKKCVFYDGIVKWVSLEEAKKIVELN